MSYWIILLIFPSFLFSSESWYERSLEGWYYFQDSAVQEESKLRKEMDGEEAEQVIEQSKRHLKQSLSLALVNPTKNNVMQYMRLQKQVVEQSSQFSNMWKEALLSDPLLGDFLNNPTSMYGIRARKQLELEEKKALIDGMASNYFLLFFFQGDNLFSAKAGEAVALFSEIHRWNVKAVSMDGLGISSFPIFEADYGISVVAGVKATPSLFIVNPKDNRVIPVGAGLMTVSEIEQNIFDQMIQEGG